MIVSPSLIESKLDINENLNLDKYIKEHHNIIAIQDCHVIGMFEFIENDLVANLNIKANLVLADNMNFEPTDYLLKFNLELIFGNSEKSDYILEKEIDLSEIIYGHILVYKPATIFSEEIKVKEKEKVNPAFKELKDWIK